MISITQQQLLSWVAMFIWPLTRILGVLAVAPIFGNTSVPARVKVGLGVAITVIIAPVIPTPIDVDLASLAGLAVLVLQFLIGTAIGFAMRVIFAAVEFAGELMGLSMGLGFALFFDPHSRSQTSAISQFLTLLLFMLFLATDMHLYILSAVTESFYALPISSNPLNTKGFVTIVKWSGFIFYTGLQIALPIISVLLVTNTALGILTRAAPQLNLFGIGFPITLGLGFVAISLALPYLTPAMLRWLESGMTFTLQIPTALFNVIK